MRQIGELPPNLDARRFEDYLLSKGVRSRFDPGPGGWTVWIFDEDHVADARRELEEFLGRPDDPKYVESAPAAAERRRKEKELDRQFRKNDRDVAEAWSGLQVRRRPATVTTIAIAIAVFLLLQIPEWRPEVLDQLGFFAWTRGEPLDRPQHALTDVVDGQVWRLITPIFLHFSLLHIVFNVWWTSVLGTAIERQRGTYRLVILLIASAVLSNLTEFAYMEWYLHDAHLFGGLSGVVYALFGYVWMKGEYEPEQGLGIDSRNTMIMLAWLVVCMTGAVGPVANAAHVGGLVAGMVLGLFRF